MTNEPSAAQSATYPLPGTPGWNRAKAVYDRAEDLMNRHPDRFPRLEDAIARVENWTDEELLGEDHLTDDMLESAGAAWNPDEDALGAATEMTDREIESQERQMLQDDINFQERLLQAVRLVGRRASTRSQEGVVSSLVGELERGIANDRRWMREVSR